MKVYKPIRTGYLSRIVIHAGQPHLAVALLHYFPFAEPRRIGLEQEMWSEIMPVLGDRILDPCDPKPRAEVVVYGSFHAPSGSEVAEGTARLRLGDVIDKRIRVTGNREWLRSGVGRLRASDPIPFSSMPLDWAHAFGGPEFEENPDGIGHWPRKAAQQRYPLPNLEYPDSVLQLPDDAIRPAALSPRPLTLPLRRKLAGTFDAYWAKHHEPGYPRDIRPEFFLTAAPDQVLPGYFQGREPFQADGMNPDHARLPGRLPGLRARCFVQQKMGGAHDTAPPRFHEVPVQPDTLVLFPELQRAILMHHGKVALSEIDGLDLDYLLAGFEWLEDDPRPLPHWQAALQRRLDPATGARAILDTADICPIGWSEPTLEAASTIKPLAPREKGAMPPRLTSLIEKVKGGGAAATAAAAAAAGASEVKSVAAAADKSDPPEVKEVLQEIDKVKDMRPRNQEEAEAFRQQMQVISDKMEALGRNTNADATNQARALAKDFGYDYDAVVAQAQAEAQAEPDILAAKLRDISERAKEGLDPTVKAKLERGMPKDLDQQFAAVFQDAKGKQAVLEKESAHLFPPPQLLAASKQAGKAKALAAALAAGEKPADQALAGMDFSGRKLDGVDFSGANLTGALFVGASLLGANLEDAGLAHADLTRANLTGAKLKGANLNKARLNGTIFAKADLSGFSLADQEGRKVSFAGAKLTGANLNGMTLKGVSFAGADLGKASFNRCVLEDADFSGAKVANTVFLFCRLPEADLRKLGGSGLKFLNCELPGARFCGSEVQKLAVGGTTMLDRADLSGCTLPVCNLSFASMIGARIRDSQLPQANFWMTDLTGADLSGSFLRGAVMMRTNLTDAALEGCDAMQANFMKATFIRTRLRAANLYGANVMKAGFKDVKFDSANITKTRLEERNMP